MASSSEPGRSTASRLFAVLNAFDRRHSALTLSALAEAAGLPIATTYRQVRELVAAGAMERNDDGTYQIGLRLWELGALAPRQRDLRGVARPAMERLHEVTGETVQLVVMDRGRALCIEKVSGTRSAANLTEVAGGLPLHATAVGKVILTFAEFPQPVALERRRLRAFTPHTIMDGRRLSGELDRVRTENVAYCREELTIGTSSVAAPVFGADGRFVAALGVLVGARGGLPKLAPAVRAAAQSVSRRLGHPEAEWVYAGRG